MAATRANTFYARPVVLGNGGDKFRTIASTEANHRSSLKKHTRFADTDTSEPPPRPPPPRPVRGIRKGEVTSASDRDSRQRQLPVSPGYIHGSNGLVNFGDKGGGSGSRESREPFTRLNVTSHDRLWLKDTDVEGSDPPGVLSPPMRYITPESTAEMVRNFDPLDIDTLSDHSDASVDTMIMMTTEEEQKNQERINHSLQEFTSLKSKHDSTETNRSKASIQSKKNLHIHFADMNGIDNSTWRRANVPTDSDDKVAPLHITTDQNGSSPESANKSSSNHTSPNDSPDDGYGTNSSSGTVSSPFSSSFGSTDFENSYGNSSSRKVILPNGAIKPNSVRESWAVKRKQRMIEAQDNSVQEQLRQLTIIEEEGGAGSGGGRGRDVNLNSNLSGRSKLKHSDKTVLKARSPGSGVMSTPNQNGVVEDSTCVDVSSNDLQRINRQLYVLSSERDAILGNSQPSRTERVLPNPPSEYTSVKQRQVPLSQMNGDVTYSLPQKRSKTLPRSSGNTVLASGFRPRNKSEGGDESLGDNRTNGLGSDPSNRRLVGQTEAQCPPPIPPRLEDNNGQWEDESDYSAISGPFLLRGGEQKYPTPSGSGNIYVSPTGDEGIYSLNRSSRSTSVSSFQPISEEPVTLATDIASVDSEAPKSPLEVLSGELLEKWSDMDRNYRNYYGFDEKSEKYTRTDSKVNYFQEKKLNNMYGSDNYYRPQAYSGDIAPEQRTQSMRQLPTHQGNPRDSKEKPGILKTSSRPTQQQPQQQHKHSKSGKDKEKDKEKDSKEHKQSKLFQILPNMFKPSSKKSSSESKEGKHSKGKRTLPVPVVPEVVKIEVKHDNTDEMDQAEYLNIGDLPQYCLAQVEYEEKLRKGQFVSLESLHKRPVFASSRDIKKLFQTHDQSFDSINSPGGQRHSFHAMPLSYRHRGSKQLGSESDMRPRAASASASMRSQQLQNSIDSRMALIARKNAAVMSQAGQIKRDETGSIGNNSYRSNSPKQQLSGSRVRLDSGSSGGDSKLSTLV